MKALEFVAEGVAKVNELAIPDIAEDEVLIASRAVGVCHSDIELLEGRRGLAVTGELAAQATAGEDRELELLALVGLPLPVPVQADPVVPVQTLLQLLRLGSGKGRCDEPMNFLRILATRRALHAACNINSMGVDRLHGIADVGRIQPSGKNHADPGVSGHKPGSKVPINCVSTPSVGTGYSRIEQEELGPESRGRLQIGFGADS